MYSILHRAAAGALLLFMFLLAAGASLHESAAVDEIAHVGAGLSYVQKLDLRMNQEHPPLSKVIAGIPLALRGTSADYSGPAWRESDSIQSGYLLQWVFGDLVQGRWNDWRSTLAWARFPMLLLTLWLGLMIYRYAVLLSTPTGGLLCLALYCTTPAFLVFGPLVITDVPVTLFTLMSLWQLGEVWASPSPRTSLLFGCAFGAAMLSKFTGLILFAVVIALFVQTRFWPSAGEPTDRVERKAWRRLRWRAVWKGAFWALLIVYVFYLVFSWNQPDSALDKIGGDTFWIHALRRLLMPIWLYVRGILLMLFLGSRSTFLLGYAYRHGVPFYFPVVFVLKSPLGYLLLLVMAAVLWAVLRHRRDISLINRNVLPHWRVLMIGFFVFLVLCILSQLDISIRHFTIPMVLLLLMLAPLPRMLSLFSARRRPLQLVTAALVASCFFAVVPAYPYFFPFVNSLALGRPVYQLVNDSNVDWNQTLPEVEQYTRAHGWAEVKLDWLALADPSAVVPEVRPWDCQAASPSDAGQWVVVSAVMILENRNCGWLERYPHEPIAHGGMYAFHLPDLLPPAGAAGGPPLPVDRKAFFGTPFDIRSLIVDLERHPERIAPAMKEMAKRYKQQSTKKSQ